MQKKKQTVFVVHGRNMAARNAVFTFLQSLGLNPLEWDDAVKSTGDAAPYVGTVLKAGFKQAQAILVLLTGDDFAVLDPAYQQPYEDASVPQPRQNVAFEAGMALAKYPGRTILASLGRVTLFSDIVGRYMVRLDHNPGSRTELRSYLERCGCLIEPRDGWETAGDFDAPERSSTTSTIRSPLIEWRSRHPPPDPGIVLGATKHSLVILGLSNYRIVSDNIDEYETWLKGDRRRLMALLFLNPFSPHMFNRRLPAARSSLQDLQHSLQRVSENAARVSGLVPAVYDGPYRYSAVGIDINEKMTRKITLLTSSHSAGINSGFRIVITPEEQQECFLFYERELLRVWRSAIANEPGHGISIVSRCGDFRIQRQIEHLEEHVLDSDEVFEPLNLGQLHVTLASLRRSQQARQDFTFPSYRPSFEPPLFIGRPTSPGHPLPEEFPQFIANVIAALQRSLRPPLRYELTQVVRGQDGKILLAGDMDHGSTALMTTLREIAEKYFRSRNDGNLFKPKYETFCPHLTIGHAFKCSNHYFPTLSAGRELKRPLPKPVVLEVDLLSVVHYAYRSLLRCVGELPFTIKGGPSISPAAIKAELGIGGPEEPSRVHVTRSVSLIHD
ncbi:MAG: nucleotide-binding protein [Bryobacteraceae bacterium]|nr:nucleotide-binding protein [Bryobacteraceae bacterium]